MFHLCEYVLHLRFGPDLATIAVSHASEFWRVRGVRDLSTLHLRLGLHPLPHHQIDDQPIPTSSIYFDTTAGHPP